MELWSEVAAYPNASVDHKVAGMLRRSAGLEFHGDLRQVVTLQQNGDAMNEKTAPRGRPTKNKMERIPASPEHIAQAIFKAADKKISKPKKRKKKPN
jgi:hypothetical protein